MRGTRPVQVVLELRPGDQPVRVLWQFRHGVYCLGCCWLLFVALFPLGMTIEAMAAVTLIILGEKTLPRPEFVSYGAAAALVVCGMLMAVAPELPAVLRVFGSLRYTELAPTRFKSFWS